jgi:hypothetical protein
MPIELIVVFATAGLVVTTWLLLWLAERLRRQP